MKGKERLPKGCRRVRLGNIWAYVIHVYSHQGYARAAQESKIIRRIKRNRKIGTATKCRLYKSASDTVTVETMKGKNHEA